MQPPEMAGMRTARVAGGEGVGRAGVGTGRGDEAGAVKARRAGLTGVAMLRGAGAVEGDFFLLRIPPGLWCL